MTEESNGNVLIPQSDGGTAFKRRIVAATLWCLLATVPATASGEEPPLLPSTVTFATSTGYWEGEAGLPEDAATQSPTGGKATPERRGYYKLYAVRQPDATSRVYLQQVAVTGDGPQVLSTVELSEITALKAYVTDIRPENSGGLIRQPGLFASIILKTTPNGEPESWTVLINDLGEVIVERASN
jgi:hypothetical protein